MEIVELSPEEPAHLEGAAALANAVRDHEAPWQLPTTPQVVEGYWRYGWDLEPGRQFGGFADGRLVAHGAVNTTEWDNPDLAWLGVTIHPEVRGGGLGQAMVDHVEAVATGVRRTKLGIDAWDGSDGVSFAERNGYKVGSRAVNRRQHLADVSLDDVRALHDEAAAAASSYELFRLAGRTPEKLLDDVAVLTAAINDAPLDDLDIDDEEFPPERIRNYETAIQLRGERMYRLLARSRDTGELAGQTIVAVESTRPGIAHQHDTSVVRSHRGHRLGLLLKSGMNLWLAEEEPGLEVVDTWNAESNDHMIGVNEALGYRWMAREVQLQKSVAG